MGTIVGHLKNIVEGDLSFDSFLPKKPLLLEHTLVPQQDRELFKLLRTDSYRAVVAGGSALRWWGGQSVDNHDIDLWFTKVEDVQRAITYYNSIGMETHHSKNAKTYRINVNGRDYMVQVIYKLYTNIDQLFENFDITVCRVATDGVRWWTGPHFAGDYRTRTLRMMKLRENSLRRYVKYVSYGYQPTPDLLQRLLNDPAVNLDYTNSESFEDYEDA